MSEFLEKRKIENLQELERKCAPAAAPVSVAPQKKAFEENRKAVREDRKRKNRISWLEKEIAGLEEKMKQIEEVLQSPKEGDDIMELTRSYLELKRELDSRTDEWGELID